MVNEAIPAAVRLAHWEVRLSGIIYQRMFKPFEWGVNDCVLFAADCAKAMTGHDYVAHLRGTWSCRKTAVRAITRAGGLAAAVEGCGLVACGPMFARRGDVVMHRRDGIDALAICLGDKLAGPSDSGLLFFGLEHGIKAWRV